MNVAYFESEAKYRAWVESDHFHDHLTRIQHLVQRVEPTLYRVLRGRLKHVDGILYRCHGERIQVAEACGFESLTGNRSLPFRRAYLARDKGCGNAAPERAGTARVRSRLKQVRTKQKRG